MVVIPQISLIIKIHGALCLHVKGGDSTSICLIDKAGMGGLGLGFFYYLLDVLTRAFVEYVLPRKISIQLACPGEG